MTDETPKNADEAVKRLNKLKNGTNDADIDKLIGNVNAVKGAENYETIKEAANDIFQSSLQGIDKDTYNYVKDYVELAGQDYKWKNK